MVLSLYFSKLFVTKRSTIDDLPTPVSPSKTTFTSRGACKKEGERDRERAAAAVVRGREGKRKRSIPPEAEG
jgi:hypothetical protein